MENGAHVEVIDLEDPKKTCSPFPDMTTVHEAMLEGGVGGLLRGSEGSVPVTCGGQYYDGYECYSCFRVEKNGTSKLVDMMTHAFHYAASVVLNEDTLWITGGYTTVSHLQADTEFVRVDGYHYSGPMLPYPEFGHCMVKGHFL